MIGVHDRTLPEGVFPHLPAPFPEEGDGELPLRESPRLPQISRQASADAGRKRAGKVRGVRVCSVACPADAIYLEAAENDGSVLAGPRYASVYQIHKTRCIFCGMCEEACPVSAIFMGKDYELAVYSKDDFVWDKTDLLVAPQAGALPQGVPACRRSFQV